MSNSSQHPYGIYYRTMDIKAINGPIYQHLANLPGLSLLPFSTQLIEIRSCDLFIGFLGFWIYKALKRQMRPVNSQWSSELSKFDQLDATSNWVELNNQLTQFMGNLLQSAQPQIGQEQYNRIAQLTGIQFTVQEDHPRIQKHRHLNYAFNQPDYSLLIYEYGQSHYALLTSVHNENTPVAHRVQTQSAQQQYQSVPMMFQTDGPQINSHQSNQQQFTPPIQHVSTAQQIGIRMPSEQQIGPQQKIWNTIQLQEQPNLNPGSIPLDQTQYPGSSMQRVSKPQVRTLTILHTVHCDVCDDDLHQNDLILLDCGCRLHTLCLQSSLKATSESTCKFSDLKCFKCNRALTHGLIRKLLGPEIFHKILQVESNSYTSMNCFNCQAPFQLDSKVQESHTQLAITCHQCSEKSCSLCKQKLHQMEDGMPCQFFRDQMFTVLKGQPIIVCPFCNTISTKDDKCDHVKCAKCSNDLCAVCSVDRSPTMVHGSHYHRVGCKHYQPWIDPKTKQENLTAEYDVKCKACAVAKKACQRPMPLIEYKKLKHYPS